MAFRFRARKGSQVRYYIYVSDSKLDMLFQQIEPGLRKRISAEVKVDLKLASITLRDADSQGPTRMAKLRIVEQFIDANYDVGTVAEPGLGFFRGQLVMSWGCVEGAVLFRSYDVENSRCVVLGGSRRHVLGEASPVWQWTGASSYLPEIEDVLRRISEDEPGGDWSTRLLPDYRFISNLPPQQLDFLAICWAETDGIDNYPPIHSVLGTPLYVAIAPASTRRLVPKTIQPESLTHTLDERTQIRAVDALLPKIEQIAEAEESHNYERMLPGLKDLAASYQALGLAVNLPLDEQALRVTEAERQGGLGAIDAATALGNLAASCRALNRTQEALHLDKQALAITERALHSDHDMITALGNLAASYRALGRPAEALALNERALTIAETAPRPYHADMAIALGNLAATYRALDRAADALPLDERAVRIAELALSPDHPLMAIALGNLAATYRALGRVTDAKRLEKRGAARRTKLAAR